MRDNFPRKLAETLAKRVAFHCSNPACRKKTSGPHTEPEKALNIGVAAHITAASPGGPRYDSLLTSAQRKASKNAIWLCQDCAKLIDNDEARFPTDLLIQWKEEAERRALQEINATQARGRRRVELEEDIEVALSATFSATPAPPYGTGEPIHLEIRLTINNHGSMPVFIVSADLRDHRKMHLVKFSGVCNEDTPIAPGGRRITVNKLMYHDLPPNKPPIPRTPFNIENLKGRTRMEFVILRFVCQEASVLCVETARGNVHTFPAVDVCDHGFLGWAYLAAPPWIEDEFRGKTLADLEPKWFTKDNAGS